MKIQIPKNPKLIIDLLLAEGYEAGLVGGCLRNILLGIAANDFDIATSATTVQMKKLFKHFTVISIGEKYGTLIIVVDGENIEVTTFRKESNYSDNRRPDKVEFLSNLDEDLKRRDYTINALYYNDKVGLIDHYQSISDINKKIIRAVGDPLERFEEDSLRILRGIRFAAKLKFQIEDKTNLAIKEAYTLLSNIKAERIAIELIGILNCPDIKNIINEYLPVFQFLIKDLGEIDSVKFDNMPTLRLKLAVFFSALDTKIEIYKKLMDLKLTVSSLIRKSDLRDIATIINISKKDTSNILQIYRELKWNRALLEEVYTFSTKSHLFNEIPSIGIQDMAIKGTDVLSLGFSDEMIQQILDECFYNLLLGKISNTKSAYCDLITEKYSNKVIITLDTK